MSVYFAVKVYKIICNIYRYIYKKYQQIHVEILTINRCAYRIAHQKLVVPIFVVNFNRNIWVPGRHTGYFDDDHTVFVTRSHTKWLVDLFHKALYTHFICLNILSNETEHHFSNT